jgi:hypothetical protein
VLLFSFTHIGHGTTNNLKFIDHGRSRNFKAVLLIRKNCRYNPWI